MSEQVAPRGPGRYSIKNKIGDLGQKGRKFKRRYWSKLGLSINTDKPKKKP